MKLVTKTMLRAFPPLGATVEMGGDAIVVAKYFVPRTYWKWYALEFNGVDTFFGVVQGYEREYGYFSLRELESIRGAYHITVERDLHWRPIPIRLVIPEMFKAA